MYDDAAGGLMFTRLQVDAMMEYFFGTMKAEETRVQLPECSDGSGSDLRLHRGLLHKEYTHPSGRALALPVRGPDLYSEERRHDNSPGLIDPLGEKTVRPNRAAASLRKSIKITGRISITFNGWASVLLGFPNKAFSVESTTEILSRGDQQDTISQ